jgi:hypothetical protein
MVYNVEISFNILKNKNVSELENFITLLAKDNNCSLCYSMIEMENTSLMQRNHSIITSIFKEVNIKDLVEFIKIIKKMNGIYIESIFNEETNQIIYASKYYLTIMDKYISNNYQLNKRKRSYSEDETMIIDEIKKK